MLLCLMSKIKSYTKGNFTLNFYWEKVNQILIISIGKKCAMLGTPCTRLSWFSLLIAWRLMRHNARTRGNQTNTNVYYKKKLTFELRRLFRHTVIESIKRILIRKIGIFCILTEIFLVALFCVCERSHFHSLIASSSMTSISNVFRERHRFNSTYAVILCCNFISCFIYFD